LKADIPLLVTQAQEDHSVLPIQMKS